MGFVVLEPNGGQVPWHNQEQEEIYFVVEGMGRDVPGRRRQTLYRRSSGVYPAHRVPPTDQYRRYAPLQMILAATALRVMSPTGARSLRGRCQRPGVDAPRSRKGLTRSAPTSLRRARFAPLSDGRRWSRIPASGNSGVRLQRCTRHVSIRFLMREGVRSDLTSGASNSSVATCVMRAAEIPATPSKSAVCHLRCT